MCVGDYQRYDGDKSDPEGITSEIMKCHSYLGVNKTKILTDLEGRLDTVSESKLVGMIDEILSDNYDRVLFPYPSRHVDHRVTYNTVLASLRLRADKEQEKEVFLYEYPFITGLDSLKGGGVFLKESA